MGLDKHPDSVMPPGLPNPAVAMGSRATCDNPKPEVGLSDMPTELICQIITNFEPEDKKKALWSLLLTSQRFHTIVEDHIFADLSLIDNTDHKHNDDESYRRTYQLVHRLTTKPELYRSVKSVKTDSWKVFGIYSRLQNRLDQDHSRAAQLLALLPDIKSLSLYFPYGSPSRPDIQGSFDFSLQLPDVVILNCSTVNFHRFPSLTTLDLSFNYSWQWKPLNGSFFLHPSLEKVVLDFPTFKGNHYWQCVPYTSPVTELHLLHYSPFNDSISKWWTLLESFAELKSLYIKYGCSGNLDPCPFDLLHQRLVKQQDALEIFELWSLEQDPYPLQPIPFELHRQNPFVGCVSASITSPGSSHWL